MTERWETAEEIAAARDRFEEDLSWRRPAAWGLLHDGPDGAIVPGRANVRESYLPAVILATVAGHTEGTSAHRVSAADLDRAIAMLEPAEACTAMEHPNLKQWRELRKQLGGSGSAVFVAVDEEDLGGSFEDPYITAFLDKMRRTDGI